VDVLVSEWLGSFAFFESMVESVRERTTWEKKRKCFCFAKVVVARDRLLKKESGVILPSRIRLFGAPVMWQDPEAEFWKNSVEGFDFRHVGEIAAKERRARPVHNMVVQPEALQDREKQLAGIKRTF
jgi:hypothetical protein